MRLVINVFAVIGFLTLLTTLLVVVLALIAYLRGKNKERPTMCAISGEPCIRGNNDQSSCDDCKIYKKSDIEPVQDIADWKSSHEQKTKEEQK